MKTETSSFIYAVIRNLAVKAIGIPASFLCTVLLANHLGSADYGYYTLLISVATVAIAGLSRVYSVLLVRELAAATTLGKPEYISGGLLFCSVLAIPLIAFLYVWPNVLSLPPAPAGLTTVSTILLIVLMLSVILTGAALRGLHQTSLGLFVEQVGKPVFQLVLLLFAGGFSWQASTLSPKFALDSLLLALLVSTIVGLIALIYRIGQANVFSWPRFKLRWLTKTVPILLVVGYMGGLNMQLPVLLLGKFSSVADVGQYKIAISIASLIGVTLLTVNMALGPRLSALNAKKDLVGYEHTLRQACTLSAWLAIPLAVLFSVFADQIILGLFNSDYAGAARILWICCVAQVINCFCGPVSLAFNMLDKEASNIKAIALSIVVGLLAGVLLVPEFGALGAALVSVLTTLSWNLYLVLKLKTLFNISSLPYLNPGKVFSQKQ